MRVSPRPQDCEGWAGGAGMEAGMGFNHSMAHLFFQTQQQPVHGMRVFVECVVQFKQSKCRRQQTCRAAPLQPQDVAAGAWQANLP